MSVRLLQCANCGYKFKVKLNLEHPMHLSHLMSKKFCLFKIRKPNRVLVTLSHCLPLIHKFLCLYLNYLSVFLGVFTIIIFGVVIIFFHIVCFKNFNRKNVCMFGFRSCVNILFFRDVVSTNVKTILDGRKDEPGSLNNLFLNA